MTAQKRIQTESCIVFGCKQVNTKPFIHPNVNRLMSHFKWYRLKQPVQFCHSLSLYSSCPPPGGVRVMTVRSVPLLELRCPAPGHQVGRLQPSGWAPRSAPLITAPRSPPPSEHKQKMKCRFLQMVSIGVICVNPSITSSSISQTYVLQQIVVRQGILDVQISQMDGTSLKWTSTNPIYTFLLSNCLALFNRNGISYKIILPNQKYIMGPFQVAWIFPCWWRTGNMTESTRTATK